MSKTADFIKNAMDIILGEEEASDAANRRNREIVREATDEELQEIADQSRDMFKLDDLKKAREHFRQAFNRQVE